MPWQDRLVEANEKIHKVGGVGFGKRDSIQIGLDQKTIFDMAKIPGSIAMLEGGGAAPLGILIQTENGWLVRVTLSGAQAHALADLLVASVRKVE